MKRPEIKTSAGYAIVRLYMPKEWGNARAIIDPAMGNSPHDMVYTELSGRVRLLNQYPEPGIAHLEDVTNGFDTDTFRFGARLDNDMDVLKASAEKLKELMHLSYMIIPYHRRKRAKQT
jgi:hypothetical protein